MKNILKRLPWDYFSASPLNFFRWTRYIAKTKSFEHFYNSAFQNIRAGSLVFHVSEFQGEFEIGFRSHLFFRLMQNKSYEPQLADLIKTVIDPDKDMLDVGANVGFFSIFCAQLISHKNSVLSVEPTPLALQYLKNNVERNHCSKNIRIFEGVVSDEEKPMKLNVIPGNEEYSSLKGIKHPAVAGKDAQWLEVQSSTIDSLVTKYNLSPGLIKIDTEGAEFQVLKGAAATLEQHKPVILCELSDTLLSESGNNADTVVQYLEGFGYRVINAEKLDEDVHSPFIGDILARPA